MGAAPATGRTDMRRGMEEQLKRNLHAGDLYIFLGRRGDLAKILWHSLLRRCKSVRSVPWRRLS
jgi:hypothetical protein